MSRSGTHSYPKWSSNGHWPKYDSHGGEMENPDGRCWGGQDPDDDGPTKPVSGTFIVPLTPENNSGAVGFARLTLENNTLSVDAVVTGLAPGETHPFHIHGFLKDGASRPPTIADDLDLDGFVETPEGQVAIGPALVALTTEDAIALAMQAPNFPVADENGTLVFNEVYELDPNNRNDAFILDKLEERTEGRALELHGINLPAGEGDGTPYEVNGTGGYVPTVPAAGGILREADGTFGQMVAALTATEFNEAALDILTALNNPPDGSDGNGDAAADGDGTADNGGTTQIAGGEDDGEEGGSGEEPTGVETYFSLLTPQNNSGVIGAALVAFDEEEGTLTVTVRAKGLTPDEEHPAHIHGFENDAASRLPTIALDTDLDGFVETPEGETAVGPVLLPLTASGDVEPDDEADDFPTADEDGTLHLRKTYEFNLDDADEALIFEELQDRLAGRAIEIHGLDIPAGEGAGTQYEVNGTGGYIPEVPVAGGLLLPFDDRNPLLSAFLQEHGLLA